MANEGAFGSLGGMGAGAGIGALLAAPTGGLSLGMGALLGAGIGGMGGGTIGGLFAKKPKKMDIGGELARIQAMFEAMRAEGAKAINREAGQGRAAAANSMATRGTYRAPVANATFDKLEGERLNSIASMNANLLGAEAKLRSELLSQLMGYDVMAQQQASQVDAARTGQLTGMSAAVLQAALMGKMGGLGGAPGQNPPGYGPLLQTPPPPGFRMPTNVVARYGAF